MIRIDTTQTGTTYDVYVTASYNNYVIGNTYYQFYVKHHISGETKRFIPRLVNDTDQSYKHRYDQFRFDIDFDSPECLNNCQVYSAQTGQVCCDTTNVYLEEGFYWYKVIVYKYGNTPNEITNSIPEEIVEEGLMEVVGENENELKVNYNTTSTRKIYEG